MSNYITVERDITVEFEIYSMTCTECSKEMEFNLYSDGKGRITCDVNPCECVKEEV